MDSKQGICASGRRRCHERLHFLVSSLRRGKFLAWFEMPRQRSSRSIRGVPEHPLASPCAARIFCLSRRSFWARSVSLRRC